MFSMPSKDLTRIANSWRLASFHTETIAVWSWLVRIVTVFWRVQPRITGLVIGATVLARFTGLAAFLIPLKVLLLAGSDGVPHYFSMMADAEDKLVWIIALSIAAAAFYLITRLLRALSEKLSDIGSREVMKEATQLALFGNQASIARRHFKEVTTLCADLIFLIIALSVMALINPPLVIGLALLIVIEYGLTAALLERRQSQLATRIRDKPEDYVQQLQTINFWSGFLFILAPFIVGAGGNILLAILGFVLLRQSLNVALRAIEAIVGLAAEKHLIDALVFRSHRWQHNHSPTRRGFHSLFERDMHLDRIQSALAGHFQEPRPVTLYWKDSSIGGVSTFVLKFGASPNSACYQEQVFAPYQAHLIENEKILFAHVGRDVLSAPVINHNFMHGAYHCRLCDYGLGKSPAPAVWNRRFLEILEQLWSIAPPDALVRAYSTSHAFLHERLTSEFLAGLALAVSSDKDATTLQTFEAALPALRDALSAMPLYIHNRDLIRSNAALRSDGGISVMLWGRWRLEPIGVYLPLRPNKAKLAAMLARVRQRRWDIPEVFSEDHLRLAAACRQLEVRVAENKYEAALRSLSTILSNPVLTCADLDGPYCGKALRHDVQMNL